MNFDIAATPLPGVMVLKRQRRGDSRGFISRLFCQQTLAGLGWSKPVAQLNHSLTAEVGTVRGLHFQYPPHAEQKLITCIQGAVWDVAVDLRPDSPSYLQWHAERLDRDNLTSLLIPEGVAHGFQVLQKDAELIYCHSAPYQPDAEGGLHPHDPALAIAWPLPVQGLSPRDSQHPFITPAFKGVSL